MSPSCVAPGHEQGTWSNSFVKPWLSRIRGCDLKFSIFLLMKSMARHIRERKNEVRWCHHILVSQVCQTNWEYVFLMLPIPTNAS